MDELDGLAEGMSFLESCSFCLFVASLYVFSLYLIPWSVRRLPRDHPSHVKYRLVYSSVATGVAVGIGYFIRHRFARDGDSFLFSIGVRLDNLVPAVATTIFLMVVFYTGPLTVSLVQVLVERYYDVSYKGNLLARSVPLSMMDVCINRWESALSSEATIILLRNLIIAPITEEIVFRGLMIPAIFSHCCIDGQVSGRAAAKYVSLRAPFFFGVAHAHHVYEKLWVNGQKPGNVLASTMLQLAYTSIFGAIASYLLVGTGNLGACISSHMICNFIGLPDLSFLDERSPMGYMHPYRYVLLVLHVFGLIAFWFLLDPMLNFSRIV